MARVGEAETAADALQQLPYDINFYIHGGNFGEMGKLGSMSMKYMESRVASALRNYQDNVEAVDVRLNIEGHEPKTYRMEVTTKMKRGKVVVSNSQHAEHTFFEAVDHMHDTLKRAVRRDKEKFFAKKRQARRVAGLERMADDGNADAAEMEEEQGGTDYGRIFDGAGEDPAPY